MAAIFRLIHEIGYQGLELTLEAQQYHPYVHGPDMLAGLRAAAEELQLRLVIGTGAPFVLSPRQHEPSLVSRSENERAEFVGFIERSLELAAYLQAEAVMLHSGFLPVDVDREQAWSWMVAELEHLCKVAEQAQVPLAFECHPTMLVRCIEDYVRLGTQVSSPMFGFTLDIGHAVCTEDQPIPEIIDRLKGRIINVHIEDIKNRVHKHLPIGQGDIAFGPIFAALYRTGYTGLVSAEFNAVAAGIDETELVRQTFGCLAGYCQNIN